MPKNYFSFNGKAYKRDLQKVIESVCKKYDQKIKNILFNRLNSLPFKKQKGQKYDARSEILQSISVIYNLKEGQPYIKVRASKKENKTYSFLGLYYEFGTGTKMKPNKNIYSPSRDIYWNFKFRPTRYNFPILKRPKGEWTDLGGNIHITKSDVKEPTQFPKEFEIESYFWFSESIQTALLDLREDIKKAIKSVKFEDYIYYEKKIIVK